MRGGDWNVAILNLFVVMLLASNVQGREAADTSDMKIVVITNAVPEYNESRVENAVQAICEELQINGFNVIPVELPERWNVSLKRTIGDAFDVHRASLAVVIFQSSVADGSVMLFTRNEMNAEAINLDATYIELPLDKDKAEVLAFQVSEKASLLFDGMTFSMSPVEIGNDAPPDKTHTKSFEHTINDNVETSSSASDLKWGGILGAAGEFAKGGTGVMGGAALGIRWRPVVRKSLDLEIKEYFLGHPVQNNGSEADMTFFTAKLRGAQALILIQRVMVGIGINLGIGVVTARGIAGPYVDDSIDVQFTWDRTAVFIFGASTELALTLNERIVLFLRVEAGGVLPPKPIRLNDAADVMESDRLAGFGVFLAELTPGIVIFFK